MADSVEIVLGANVSKAVQGLTQFGNVAKVAVGAVTAALEELVRHSINFADEIGKAAQKAGIAVEQLSALAHAGKLANVETDSLVVGFRGLSKAVAENNKSLQELGIATLNQDGTFRDSYAVLQDIADVFEQMPDGVRKTTLATDLFGKSGQNLIPLLNQGSKGLREQTEEAKRFGVVVSSELAAASEKFNDSLTKLRQILLGVGLELADKLLPLLNQLTSYLINAAVGMKPFFTTAIEGFSTLGKYLASATVYAFEFYQAFGLLLFSGSIEEMTQAINELRGETKQTIDEIWNSEKRLGDEQKKRAQDNIAYLSREEQLRHNLFIDEQLFAHQSQQYGISERAKNQQELSYLEIKQRDLAQIRAEIESHAVPGGFGVEGGSADPEKISEQAKAYNEKLLPVLREQQQIQERINALKAQDSFSGRFAENLGKAADNALNLSARLADTFSSAIMTGIDGIAAGITGLIDGTRSWGETMQQIGSQILGMFVQLIVRAVALYAIVQLLGMIPGFGPSLIKFAGLGGKASGGPVETGLYAVGEQGTEYVVNNPTLARFGTGFFDSLQRGGSAPAATPSGGGGASVHVALLNEQHQYHNWLQSTEGERVVVDIVGRNIHRFRS